MTSSRKFQVASAFDQAHADYGSAASLQHDVAQNLAERIARLNLNPTPKILEIGCGTGFLTREVMSVVPETDWVVSDIAPAMVESCKTKLKSNARMSFRVMDGEAPAVQGEFDLICASLVFQWFDNLEQSLQRLASLLRPGGHLVFSTLVHGTLREWRAVHRMFGLTAATPAFPSAAAIDGFWPAGGEGSVEEEAVLQTYSSAHDFLTTLKTIGAATPATGHIPLAAGTMRRILRYLDEQGSLPITYQVAYGIFTRTKP